MFPYRADGTLTLPSVERENADEVPLPGRWAAEDVTAFPRRVLSLVMALTPHRQQVR